MDKISVSIRVRPLDKQEAAKGSPWRISDNTISLLPGQSFTFDSVFGTESSTLYIYERSIKDIVDSTVKGFNGTVFAYGQTSSGKTYTMRGVPEEPGIISLAIHDIFKSIQQGPDREFLLRMSYMEIYNEEINDLLAPEHRKLQTHESLERGIFVAGLREEIVAMPDQVFQLMEFGEAHRHIGETNMNVYSSRSHTIFRMVIESREKSQDDSPGSAVRVSVLNLVDLAGSERIAKTGAEGARLKEGTHINKSLMTLGTVINKLSEGIAIQGGHIPYRDSKLTRILQPALGGNAKTAIICNITPAMIHVDETKGTLQFASRAIRVTNCAQVNEVLTDAALLKRQKKEIEELRSKLKESQSEHLEEEILNLRNTLLKSELERERIILELQEEKKAQAERERQIKEQAQKIENLSTMVLNSAVDDRDFDKRSKKSNRRETWCPQIPCKSPQHKPFKGNIKDCIIPELCPPKRERAYPLPPPFEKLMEGDEVDTWDSSDKFECAAAIESLEKAEEDKFHADYPVPEANAMIYVAERKRKRPTETSTITEMKEELLDLHADYQDFEEHEIQQEGMDELFLHAKLLNEVAEVRNELEGVVSTANVFHALASDTMYMWRAQVMDLKVTMDQKVAEYNALLADSNEPLLKDSKEQEHELICLKREVKTTKTAYSALEREREGLRRDVENTKTKLKDVESKLKTALQDKSKLEAEKTMLEKELKWLQSQNNLIQCDLTRRESVAERRRESIACDLSKNKNQLISTEEALHTKSVELEKAMLDLQFLQDTNGKLENALADAEEKVKLLEENLADAESEIFVANQQKENALADARKVFNELENASQQLKTAYDNVQTLQQDRMKLNDELDASKRHSRKLEDRINDLLKEKEGLVMQLTDSFLQVEEQKAISTAFDKNVSQNDINKMDMNHFSNSLKLQVALDAAQGKSMIYYGRLQENRDEVKRLQGVLEKAIDTHRVLQKTEEDLASCKQENLELKDELQNSWNECKRLEQALKLSTEEIDELSKMQDESRVLQECLEHAKNKQKILSDQITMLQLSEKAKEDFAAELQVLLRDLRCDKLKLEAELKELKATADKQSNNIPLATTNKANEILVKDVSVGMLNFDTRVKESSRPSEKQSSANNTHGLINDMPYTRKQEAKWVQTSYGVVANTENAEKQDARRPSTRLLSHIRNMERRHAELMHRNKAYTVTLPPHMAPMKVALSMPSSTAPVRIAADIMMELEGGTSRVPLSKLEENTLSMSKKATEPEISIKNQKLIRTDCWTSFGTILFCVKVVLENIFVLTF